MGRGTTGGLWRGHNLQNAMPFLHDFELLALTVAAGVQTVVGADVKGFAPFTSGTFVLTITDAQDDVDDTLNLSIQRKLPDDSYEDIVAFTEVLGNGANDLVFVADVFAGASGGDEHVVAALTAGTVLDAPWGNILRVRYVIVDPTGTDASFSLRVTANMRV